MTNKSKIEWTDITKNPIHLVKDDGSNGGHWCKKISEGCANCYAEATNQSNYFSFASKIPYTGNVPENLILDEKVLLDIIKSSESKSAKSKKIFICSMTDLFGDWVKDEWICQIFATMAIAKNYTFQVLTKRPERIKQFFEKPINNIGIANYIDYYLNDKFAHQNHELPLPNVWLGTTVENQKTADLRIPILAQIPAKVRFLSCEPLLEDINFPQEIEQINWAIVGGESGNKARPCHVNWIRSVVNQCQQSQIPVFVKQLGSNPINNNNLLKENYSIKLKHFKGGDFNEFPFDLRVREFPV